MKTPRLATIENSAVRRVSAANFVEAAVIVDASRDPVASRRFDDLIKEAQIIIEPVTEPQARIAALPMRLQSSQGNRCCSKVTISRTPTLDRRPLVLEPPGLLPILGPGR